MNPEFLKDIQKGGWVIEQVREDGAIAKCPAAGCGMRALLQVGRNIPSVDPTSDRDRRDQVIDSFEAIRELLRLRRNELALTIRETEELAGMAVDHLAKIEKPYPSRMPNFQIVLELAQALGYEIILRPAPMSPFSLRTISETRSKLETRKRRQAQFEAKRRDQIEGQDDSEGGESAAQS